MFRKSIFAKERRHPRISTSLAVELRSPQGACNALCVELGAGGMALEGASHLPVSLPVEVVLKLGHGDEVRIHAVVWWKEPKRIGLRFDLADDNRSLIEQYVEERLAQAAGG